jgi:hypothetical protein
MSRLLRINDIDVDIDEKTAIGLDLQSYDVKEPGKTFINVSNTFNVPITSNNLSIFGLANNPQSKSTKVYDTSFCNYWIDNDKIIDNAKIRVDSIQDRINLFIFEKQDFWEDIKKDLWPDFVDDLLTWLNTEKSLPIESDPFTGNASDFLDSYYSSTTGVFLPFYIGNFGDYISVGQKSIETQTFEGTTTTVGQITVNVSSSRLENAPVAFNFPTIAGQSMSDIATIAVDQTPAGITSLYDASSDGDDYILTSKTGLADSTLNIAYSASDPGITDKPTSVSTQQGVDAGSGFLERTFEPVLAGNVGAHIYLRRETADEVGIGGHFCVYVRTIFEYIESRYNINLLTSGGVLVGNIWDDTIAQKLYVPIRELDVFMRNGDSYFRINRTDPYLPLNDQKDKADKTVWDFVNSFMRHMNVLKDELTISGERIIRFARFDDLETLADVEGFNNRLTGRPKYKPFIEGYAQNNLIKFKEVFPEGDELINSKTLTSQNVNLDVNVDLIEIDAYVPSNFNANSETYSYLGDKESFKTFTFYISNESTSINVTTFYYEFSTTLYVFVEQRTMQIAELYDLGSEYNFLDDIIDYPKVYEADMWLTMADIRNFEFFKQRWIQELNGSFFVNKIKGFNPEKSKKPTTLELIKISDKTPPADPDLNNWVDGVQDDWVDGENDFWF